ncbi:hypothetical protein PoB_005748100 [Plakobranchus ocellatus]|uniref:Uncharacterized protein n=1 Tax=Plakobranchus ocellatus TaxID=259542 RepID=A0AAV4CHQ8_9GAST|nr:hypothetical protein PoB_005748100 [Plakobranchus ocellatus]
MTAEKPSKGSGSFTSSEPRTSSRGFQDVTCCSWYSMVVPGLPLYSDFAVYLEEYYLISLSIGSVHHPQFNYPMCLGALILKPMESDFCKRVQVISAGYVKEEVYSFSSLKKKKRTSLYVPVI